VRNTGLPQHHSKVRSTPPALALAEDVVVAGFRQPRSPKPIALIVRMINQIEGVIDV
jgi:hypothetical protein